MQTPAPKQEPAAWEWKLPGMVFCACCDDSWAQCVQNAESTCVCGSATLDASASTPSPGATITGYAWDLDNNGTFETIGQNALFDPQALGFTGSQTRTVNLRVTDGDTGQAIATTTVEILGVGTALIGGVLHVVGSDSNR